MMLEACGSPWGPAEGTVGAVRGDVRFALSSDVDGLTSVSLVGRPTPLPTVHPFTTYRLLLRRSDEDAAYCVAAVLGVGTRAPRPGEVGDFLIETIDDEAHNGGAPSAVRRKDATVAQLSPSHPRVKAVTAPCGRRAVHNELLCWFDDAFVRRFDARRQAVLYGVACRAPHLYCFWPSLVRALCDESLPDAVRFDAASLRVDPAYCRTRRVWMLASEDDATTWFDARTPMWSAAMAVRAAHRYKTESWPGDATLRAALTMHLDAMADTYARSAVVLKGTFDEGVMRVLSDAGALVGTASGEGVIDPHVARASARLALALRALRVQGRLHVRACHGIDAHLMHVVRADVLFVAPNVSVAAFLRLIVEDWARATAPTHGLKAKEITAVKERAAAKARASVVDVDGALAAGQPDRCMTHVVVVEAHKLDVGRASALMTRCVSAGVLNVDVHGAADDYGAHARRGDGGEWFAAMYDEAFCRAPPCVASAFAEEYALAVAAAALARARPRKGGRRRTPTTGARGRRGSMMPVERARSALTRGARAALHVDEMSAAQMRPFQDAVRDLDKLCKEEGGTRWLAMCSSEADRRWTQAHIARARVATAPDVHAFRIGDRVHVCEMDAYGALVGARRLTLDETTNETKMASYCARGEIPLWSAPYAVDVRGDFGELTTVRSDRATLRHADVVPASTYAGPPAAHVLVLIGTTTTRRDLLAAVRTARTSVRFLALPGAIMAEVMGRVGPWRGVDARQRAARSALVEALRASPSD